MHVSIKIYSYHQITLLICLVSIMKDEMTSNCKPRKIESTSKVDFKSIVFHFFHPSCFSSFSVPGLVATHKMAPDTSSVESNFHSHSMTLVCYSLMISVTMPAPTPRPRHLAEVTRISRRVKCSAPSSSPSASSRSAADGARRPADQAGPSYLGKGPGRIGARAHKGPGPEGPIRGQTGS